MLCFSLYTVDWVGMVCQAVAWARGGGGGREKEDDGMVPSQGLPVHVARLVLHCNRDAAPSEAWYRLTRGSPTYGPHLAGRCTSEPIGGGHASRRRVPGE